LKVIIYSFIYYLFIYYYIRGDRHV
jgi:hypothetical protein